MKNVLKACKKCKLLTEDKVCPIHGDEKTTESWSGFLLISEPAESTIAARAGITTPGMYAIKVRQ
ncbi:MAG: DNA-directed RNA polymerase subunit E'' [Candidatus Thermoplasmatota archaeon]|nr:DNA-directed RNA polymerase subunit E'' [Candidatus Thermoplasmatota archaeon]MCL5665357.1 DNA-directed RNA polymerase subunit E'' [Candidatus Thermoplasmatota archaeon]